MSTQNKMCHCYIFLDTSSLPRAKTASLSRLAASFGSKSSEARRVSCPRRLWVYGTANRSSCLAKDVMVMLKDDNVILCLMFITWQKYMRVSICEYVRACVWECVCPSYGKFLYNGFFYFRDMNCRRFCCYRNHPVPNSLHYSSFIL